MSSVFILVLLYLCHFCSSQTCNYEIGYGCDDYTWQFRDTRPYSLCYKIVMKLPHEIRRYEEAAKFCEDLGAGIGRVQDSLEQEYFMKSWVAATSSYAGQKQGHILLGAMDNSPSIASPAQFKWAFDNSPMKWNNWHKIEPSRTNAYGVEERCVGARNGTYDFELKWNDVPCIHHSDHDGNIGVFCMKIAKPLFKDIN